MIRQVFAIFVLLLPALSFAHGGEDHGASAEPAGVATATPRGEAQTDLFEVVVTPQNGQLTIFISDYASNQSVNDAKVEIESGQWKAIAGHVEKGTYRIAAPQFATPGDYPLVLTVTAGDTADLIETTLVVKEPAQPTVQRTLPSPPAWWRLGGALAALIVVATLFLKRRKSAHQG